MILEKIQKSHNLKKKLRKHLLYKAQNHLKLLTLE